MLTHHIVPHAAFFLQDYTDITAVLEENRLHDRQIGIFVRNFTWQATWWSECYRSMGSVTQTTAPGPSGLFVSVMAP
jgi:hypothetical protein